MDEGVGPGRWQDDLYDLLRRNNVTQFAYVPDAGHRILIDRSLADQWPTYLLPTYSYAEPRHVVYGRLTRKCSVRLLKGDRCPPEAPEAARVDGHRFFRPDQDYRHEHFQRAPNQTLRKVLEQAVAEKPNILA